MAKKKIATPAPNKIKINRLKVILAEKDLSQKDLAKKVGRAANTITRICNNESQPTLKFLRELAIALNVDIRELLVPTKGGF
jgi:putative transcriptional regulator